MNDGLFFTYVDEAKNDGEEAPVAVDDTQIVKEAKIEEDLLPKEPEKHDETDSRHNPRYVKLEDRVMDVPRLKIIPPQPPKTAYSGTARRQKPTESLDESQVMQEPQRKPKTARTQRRYGFSIIRRPKIRYVPPPKPSRKEIKQVSIFKEVKNNPMHLPASVEDLDLLISKLNEDYQSALFIQNYDEAQNILRIINHANAKKKYAEKRKMDNKCRDEVKKHNELCQTARSRISEWEEKYERFKKEVDQHTNEIIQQNNKELEEFDKTEPKEIPNHYRRASRELRELRDQEKFYSTQGDTFKAKNVKDLADKKQQEEEQAILNAVKEDFLKRRETLIRKQKNKLHAYLMRAQSTQYAMIRTRDVIASGYSKRIGLMESTIEKRIENGEMKRKELKNATSC